MGRQRKVPEHFRSEFDALKNAIHRCHNDQHHAFYNYGARGISVQDELRTQQGWRVLIDAIGPRPARGYSLDRIDNDGDYTIDPPNLRWADRKTQQNNRRKYNAERRDYGWGFSGHGKSPLLECNGRLQTLKEWADELGINPATIRQRLHRGLTVAEALNSSTSREGEKRAPRGTFLISPTVH